MGKIANCQYVCNAINAYASRSYVPASGTALQCANVEYLIKMIDKTTRDITGGGNASSNYQATYNSTQVVDIEGVRQVLPLIKWKVTAPGSIANGSITASATYVGYGETVTVTLSPSSGYELDTISATGVTLSGSGNTRTFTMPKSNVTITGSFKAIFQTQTYSTPGTHSLSMPVGTFKMTAVSGKGGNGGVGGAYGGGTGGGGGGTGSSRYKATETFTLSAMMTVSIIVGEDGKNGSQGTAREGTGKDTTTYFLGGAGGATTIGNGQAGARGEPTIETSYSPRSSGGGGSGGGASGVDGQLYVRGGGGGGGGSGQYWTGQSWGTGESGSNGNTHTGGNGGAANNTAGAGGNGGNGGSLTGTALTGTTTTESPYVKIELA
jgi:hypothetical protein